MKGHRAEMIKRIGDSLSRIVDVIDRFIEEEIERFKSLVPYRGKHRKGRRTTPGDCDGCMGPSYDYRDCEECEE